MVLGEEESVLFREVSSFQGCPYGEVPLYILCLVHFTVSVMVSASFLVRPSLTVLCAVAWESLLVSMTLRRTLRISCDLEIASVASRTDSWDSGENASYGSVPGGDGSMCSHPHTTAPT